MQGAEMRLVLISCQAKSYNILCYYCIPREVVLFGAGPPESRARAGPPEPEGSQFLHTSEILREGPPPFNRE